MKKFMLFDQDEEPIVELEHGKFNCGILKLGGGYFVVTVAPHQNGRAYPCAVFRSVSEAASAVQGLWNFAFSVNADNQGFAFPVSEDDPVTALEIIDTLLLR